MTGTWKTVRVFISSTFRDMHAERDHLVKVTFPKLRQWCEERRLHLVDIDLRWGVTKEQADNGAAIEICLKEIDGCRPFFLCFLGNRYGWVPDDLPPEELYRFRGLQAETHLSITHLEILHAALVPIATRDGKTAPRCKQAFFYLRRPECVPTSEDSAGLTAHEREEHHRAFFEASPLRRQMLVNLKAEIRANFSIPWHVVEYEGRWDFGADNPEDNMLKGRLTGLDRLGRWVEVHLRRAIREQYAEHLATLDQEPDPLIEERSFHEAFLENRTQVHVPRTDVESQLTDYVRGDDRRPLVLSGPPGSGKSAILAHWISQNVHRETWQANLADWHDAFVVARFIGASPGSTSLSKLLANLCEELRKRFTLTEEVEIAPARNKKRSRTHRKKKRTRTQSMEVPVDPAQVVSKWPQFLEAAAKQGRIVIVLDAIDQLDRAGEPMWLLWLPRKLPKRIRMVVSILDHGDVSNAEARPPQGESSDALSILRRLKLPEVTVPDLDDDLRRTIIQELPSIFCKTLDAAQVSLLIKNEATRNPLFLTVALEELRVFGGYGTKGEVLHRKIAALPQLGIDSDIDAALNLLFGHVLDRLDSETHRRTPGLVPALFRLLASAREGLSEGELDGVLAQVLPGLDLRDRSGIMRILLRQVRPFLMRKGTAQGALVDFYHRSFWKAVRAKYLSDEFSRNASHHDLAEFFNAQDYWLESLEDQRKRSSTFPPSSRPANARKVTELPWQRFREQDGTALAFLFMNFNFLEAKAEAGLIFELASDFAEAGRRMSPNEPASRLSRLLGKAIAFDIHFISRHPTSLFQCLWNRCWWYDSPESVHYYDAPEGGWPAEGPPWSRPGPKLHRLLEEWRDARALRRGDVVRLLSVRPPHQPLGSPLLAQFGGHESWVNSVAFVPGSTPIHVAAALTDGTIRIWEVVSGAPIVTLQAHNTPVACLAFSPDGTRLASGSRTDGVVSIWDAANCAPIMTLQAHKMKVACLAYSPDGTRLATGGWVDGKVRLWDTAKGTLVATLDDGDRYDVNCVAYSPDGRRLASGGGGGKVLVWDAADGSLVGSHQAHELKADRLSTVTGLAYSPDGTRLACGMTDGAVRILDTAGAKEPIAMIGVPEEYEFRRPIWTRVVYSPDGTRLASSAGDKVQLWDAASGAPIVILAERQWGVTSLAYSPDGTLLASDGGDAEPRVWSVTHPEPVPLLRGHESSIKNPTYSPDGLRLATGSSDGSICIWDAVNGRLLARLIDHRFPALRLAFSSVDYQRFDRWYLEGWLQCEDSIFENDHCANEVSCLTFSPDGRCLASGSPGGFIRLWNTEVEAPLFYLRGHCGYADGPEVNSLTFSPDGKRLASGAADGRIQVWDVFYDWNPPPLHHGRWAPDPGQGPWRRHWGRKRVIGLAFAPDGVRLACLTSKGTIHVVDTSSGEHWKVRGSSIRSTLVCDETSHVAFSTDGANLVVADRFGTISSWDSFSGRFLGDAPTTTDLVDMPVGQERARWLARANATEIVIESATDGAVVAWYPITLSAPTTIALIPRTTRKVAASPDLRSWAVLSGGNGLTMELVRLRIDGED